MKKKRQLVGGILLMVLGLGLGIGSMAFHHLERGGIGPFNAGQGMMNRRDFRGNYGYGNGYVNPQERGFRQNPNFKQAPTPRQAPFPKQAPAVPSTPDKP